MTRAARPPAPNEAEPRAPRAAPLDATAARLLPLSLLCAVVAFALCALLAPAVVNGDGLGYLRAAPTGERFPGHLAFLPLLRLVARLSGSGDALSLLGPARLLSFASAAAAAAALAFAAGRLLGRGAAAVAGLGLCASSGFLCAGADVESYAPALAAMCLSLAFAVEHARAGRGPLLAAGCALFAAAAALLHIENVLFLPVAALAAARDDGVRRPARLPPLGAPLAILVLSTALVAAAYLAAARARGDDLLAALRWIRGASHGFSYPVGLATPVVGFYGIAKTLVFTPYRYEASWPVVIALTAGGLVAAAALLRLALRPGRPRALAPLVMAAWLLPYTVVGLAFFASDSERWIFLLPPAWIAAAAGSRAAPRDARFAATLVGALLLLVPAVTLPFSRDDSRRRRADEVTARLHEGDLVVSPGHSWDEYVGFYRPLALDHFPVIFYCGQLGGSGAARAALWQRAAWARARGGAVWFLRGDEPASSPGWKDLGQFGVSQANVDELLPGRRVPVAPGLDRIEPATR